MREKNQLAIQGGLKTIEDDYPHFVWPVIDKKIEKAVVSQLYKTISIYDRSGIFEEFEDSFAKYHDRKYALLCSSGTLAIHSMFVAANFSAGDEVICPAYTFFATVTPLLFTGAKPVLCDCDENGNIDPKEIKKKITPKTKAVVITHMWGIPCQMDKIVDICKKNNLLLLEDCSHAHGARYKGRVVGSFGDLAAWSLQGPKNITGGEGGILVTDNKDFYSHSLLLGHYNKRCFQEIDKNSVYYKYATTGMGLKYRAHPLAIAIAYELFKNIDQTRRIKQKFAKSIINNLRKNDSIKLLPAMTDENIQPSWYALVFLCKFKQRSAAEIVGALKAEGLNSIDLPKSTSPLNLLSLFQDPTELFPIYKNKESNFSYKEGDFPKAEKFYKTAIKMPVGSYLSEDKLTKQYIKGIKKVLGGF